MYTVTDDKERISYSNYCRDFFTHKYIYKDLMGVELKKMYWIKDNFNSF